MINIAIDGYSGSGKSSLADGLAERFNLNHLSTGAILRAMGLYFYRLNKLNPSLKDFEAESDKLDIKIDFEGKVQKTYLNGEDITEAISDEKIGQMASRLAVYRPAMQKLIDVSREFAATHNCVLDGRNITSEVLPNADVKIFLDADISARAARRHQEALEKHQSSELEAVLGSLKERDWRDSHRDFSPLQLVSDAVLIDNTDMDLQQTIDYAIGIIEPKLKALGKL